MNTNIHKYKHRYIIGGIVFYIVLITIVSFIFYLRLEVEKKKYLQHRIETSKIEIESVMNSYDMTVKTIFESVINTSEIKTIMHSAVHGNDEQKKHKRKLLFYRLNNLYKSLEKNNIQQLHFHLPGSISFLRFHRPNKFGDSLKGIRPAIEMVNQTHKSVRGFEEGRIFNGYRHVYPLLMNNEFVGSIEISYSFEAIKIMAEMLKTGRYELIMKNEVVDSKVFAEEKINYVTSDVHPSFSKDIRIQQKQSNNVTDKVLKEINRIVSPIFERYYDQNLLFIISTEYENNGYLLSSYPLFSFDNKFLGYILIYTQDNHIKNLKNDYIVIFLFTVCISAIVTFLIGYFLFRLQLQHDTLVKNSNTDFLTKISNRAYVLMNLDFILKNAKRNSHDISIIFIDIDFFKQINDTYGHQAGDLVLIKISKILTERLRQCDIVGRWGGEEFIVILPHTNINDAVSVAENLRTIIESVSFINGLLTCSFGVAEYIEGDDCHSLIGRADKMLYQAKNNGRNQVFPKKNNI